MRRRIAVALSTFGEMCQWSRDVLAFRNSDWESAGGTGEMATFAKADRAATTGGVAFLCIDADRISYEPGDDKEDIGCVRWRHTGASGIDGSFKVLETRNSADDDVFYHWVPYLGAFKRWDDKLSLQLWSLFKTSMDLHASACTSRRLLAPTLREAHEQRPGPSRGELSSRPLPRGRSGFSSRCVVGRGGAP